MGATVQVERGDGVAILWLDRPGCMNALDEPMARELHHVTRSLEDDPAVRCVLVRGRGGQFMAGGDINYFRRALDLPPDARREAVHAIIGEVHGAIASIRRMPKPVVAAVEGACAGFGVSLVAACDLALAVDGAMFTLAYCHIGTTPDGSSTWTLPRTVGMKRAAELMLLGDRFDVSRAEAIGLINRAVGAGELESELSALAKRLAAGPTFAHGKGKQLLNASTLNTLDQQLELEMRSFADCTLSADFAEGVTAFCEKRKARFAGS